MDISCTESPLLHALMCYGRNRKKPLAINIRGMRDQALSVKRLLFDRSPKLAVDSGAHPYYTLFIWQPIRCDSGWRSECNASRFIRSPR